METPDMSALSHASRARNPFFGNLFMSRTSENIKLLSGRIKGKTIKQIKDSLPEKT
jgi:hypothetical protein